MTQQSILTVPWVVLEEATPPAPATAERDPVTVCAQTVEPDFLRYDFSVRSWAKSLLAGALVLAVVWLAAVTVVVIDGALFADGTVRLALVLAGVPIICLLAVAILADPNRNIGDDIYRAVNPVGQCTPSRVNMLTGGRS